MGLSTSDEQHDKGTVGPNSDPEHNAVTIVAQTASVEKDWSMPWIRICFMAF